MIKEIGTLFKLTSHGSVQSWKCWVESSNDFSTIFVNYGLDDGKKQLTSEIISSGKNIGKKNATDHFEQALSQAKSLYQKKIDKGYVENIKDVNSGGKNFEIRPMLAHKYQDKKHLIKDDQEVYFSPKLDGIRCLAKRENNTISLWSRGGKQITSMPHIVSELSQIMKDGEIWDGELYSHKLEFNDIASIVRKDVPPIDEYHKIYYYVFDAISDKSYKERYMDNIYNELLGFPLCYIKLLENKIDYISNLEKTNKFYTKIGYEGTIIRIIDNCPYEHKRSNSLMKFKTFQDEEFKVLGFKYGKAGTKLDGCVAALVLEIEVNGQKEEFDAMPIGPIELLKYIKHNQKEFLGKMVTVKFQNYSKYGKPRFGKAKGLRWDADK